MADPMTRDAMTRDEMIETLEGLQPFGACASYKRPFGPRSCEPNANDCAECLRPESDHEDRQELAAVIAALRAPAVTGEAYRAVRRLRHAVVRMWTRLDGEPGNQASVALWKMLTDEVDAALRAAPPAEDCHCGDGATLRGYIREYGETPAMTASNRKHWKRRAEAAEAKLAAPPAGAGAPPCPSCVSERGKPDAACATCHGSGRCPSAGAPPALVALVRNTEQKLRELGSNMTPAASLLVSDAGCELLALANALDVALLAWTPAPPAAPPAPEQE